MVGAFQTADAQVGGGVLYGQVLRYLHAEIGPALVDPTPGTGSGHLFAAGCAITELAGWMAHDAGRDDRARAHFDRAFRLASAAVTCRSLRTCARRWRIWRGSSASRGKRYGSPVQG